MINLGKEYFSSPYVGILIVGIKQPLWWENAYKESVGEEIVNLRVIDLLCFETHAHCFPEIKECIVWFIYTEMNILKETGELHLFYQFLSCPKWTNKCWLENSS